MSGVFDKLKAAKDQDELIAVLKDLHAIEHVHFSKEEIVSLMIQKKQEVGADDWTTEVAPLFHGILSRLKEKQIDSEVSAPDVLIDVEDDKAQDVADAPDDPNTGTTLRQVSRIIGSTPSIRSIRQLSHGNDDSDNTQRNTSCFLTLVNVGLNGWFIYKGFEGKPCDRPLNLYLILLGFNACFNIVLEFIRARLILSEGNVLLIGVLGLLQGLSHIFSTVWLILGSIWAFSFDRNSGEYIGPEEKFCDPDLASFVQTLLIILYVIFGTAFSCACIFTCAVMVKDMRDS